MKQRFLGFALAVVAVLAGSGIANAQVLYRNDDGSIGERFNNSDVAEVEDNWVANSYTVIAGGTRLVSIDYPLGETYSAQPATVAIYRGSDVHNPGAGGGLVLLQSNDVMITGSAGQTVTLSLGTPVDLNVGDVFYAAILIRNVPANLFPFNLQTTGTILGQSFWDVGPGTGPPRMQTGPYVLTNTSGATVNGALRATFSFPAQDPGNTHLRVNGTDTPRISDYVIITAPDGTQTRLDFDEMHEMFVYPDPTAADPSQLGNATALLESDGSISDIFGVISDGTNFFLAFSSDGEDGSPPQWPDDPQIFIQEDPINGHDATMYLSPDLRAAGYMLTFFSDDA